MFNYSFARTARYLKDTTGNRRHNGICK